MGIKDTWNAVYGRVHTWYKEGKDKFDEYDKKYHLKTRYEGIQRMRSGAAIIGASAPFCAASEAILPAVVCVGGVYKGSDDIVSGAMQTVNGEEVPTNAQSLAESTTKALGGSDDLAKAVGKGTEAPEELMDAKENYEKMHKVGAWVKGLFKSKPKLPPKLPPKPYYPPDDIQ